MPIILTYIFAKVQSYDSWQHIPRQDGFTLVLLHSSRSYTSLLEAILQLSASSNISFAALTWKEDVLAGAGEHDVLIYVPNDMTVQALNFALSNLVDFVLIEGEIFCAPETRVGSILEVIRNHQLMDDETEQQRYLSPSEDDFDQPRPRHWDRTVRIPVHTDDLQTTHILRERARPRGFAFGDVAPARTGHTAKPTIQEYASTPENQIAINNAVMKLGGLGASFSSQCVISLEEINWQTLGIVAIYSKSSGFDFFVATYCKHDVAEKMPHERHPLTREPILAIQKFANLQEFADILPRLITKPKLWCGII